MNFISDFVHSDFKDKVLREYARKFGNKFNKIITLGDDVMLELSGYTYEFDDRIPEGLDSERISSLCADFDVLDSKLDYIRKKHIFNNLEAVADFARKDEIADNSNSRVAYNREVYRKLITMMRPYFYKEYIHNDFNKDVSLLGIYNDDMNVGVLAVPFALTYLNVYFELIYSDINDFFKKTKVDGSYDPSIDYDKEAKDFSIFLLDKYNGDVAITGEIISEAIGKFFTDNKIIEMPDNTPGRQTMRNLRKYFPQIPARNKTTRIKELRNLSSHGDYELVNQNGSLVVEKNGVSISMEHILGLVNKLQLDGSANGRSRFVDCFVKDKYLKSDIEFLDFLKANTNSTKNLNTCGFDDKKVLDMLTMASFYSLLQYNVQQYFKHLNDVKSDDVDSLNFNNLFELEQDGGLVTKAKSGDLSQETLLYNKYDYLKNAMGHGNLHATENGIIGFNTKGYTLITISMLNVLEYMTQTEFCSTMVQPYGVRGNITIENYHSGEDYAKECQNTADERLSYYDIVNRDRENSSALVASGGM